VPNDQEFKKLLSEIHVLRPPKHQLATFGTTTLNYVVLSPLLEATPCRLRRGEIVAQKPRIVTPAALRKRFEGFGEDEAALGEMMDKLYGSSLKALEYVFKNNLKESTLEHTPVNELRQRVSDAIEKEDVPRTAFLQAPDRAWSLAVMKFIVDMSLRSFPTHVRELDERGLFDPAGREMARQRGAIEALFRDARSYPSARDKLGETLKASGLFSEYEDRFFALFAR